VVSYDKAAHDTDLSLPTEQNVLKQGSWDPCNDIFFVINAIMHIVAVVQNLPGKNIFRTTFNLTRHFSVQTAAN
jgi:hypothetical protein